MFAFRRRITEGPRAQGSCRPNRTRIDDRGLPEFGSDHRGDLLLRIGVHIPESLSTDERKRFEELRDLSGSKR